MDTFKVVPISGTCRICNIDEAHYHLCQFALFWTTEENCCHCWQFCVLKQIKTRRSSSKKPGWSNSPGNTRWPTPKPFLWGQSSLFFYVVCGLPRCKGSHCFTYAIIVVCTTCFVCHSSVQLMLGTVTCRHIAWRTNTSLSTSPTMTLWEAPSLWMTCRAGYMSLTFRFSSWTAMMHGRLHIWIIRHELCKLKDLPHFQESICNRTLNFLHQELQVLRVGQSQPQRFDQTQVQTIPKFPKSLLQSRAAFSEPASEPVHNASSTQALPKHALRYGVWTW